MEMMGVHIHPHSNLFEIVLIGCVVAGAVMNVVAVVLGVWALWEIRCSTGQLDGSKTAYAGIAWGLILLALAAVLTPTVYAAREAARVTQCKCNLKQLGLAFHNYHDAHKAFPPAAICDQNGSPLLSWRVAILPFSEERDLYDQFHLDEPWDSPHNLPLADSMPPQFRCPSDMRSKPNAASYAVVEGSGTYFQPGAAVGIKDVKDGSSVTIMAAEVSGNKAPWTKPDNVVFDEGFDGQAEFSSGHPGGWQALMGDGTVRFIRREVPARTIRALFTIAGREIVSEEDF
jgi:hypothetical protein